MIVLDASAIVAILTGEPECESLAAVLERADGSETSPIAVFEASLALRRKKECSIAQAEDAVTEFLRLAGVRVAPIEPRAAHDALEAYSRYGKGARHPARLNLGDCFAYAHAASLLAALLFKGEDFSMTDIERAR